jgi:hypothetical protein
LAADEVADLDEPELDQRFQAVIHGTQAHTHLLPELPLGKVRILMQQTQNLKSRLVLDFRSVIQSLVGTFLNATATPVQPIGWAVAGGSFNLEQG